MFTVQDAILNSSPCVHNYRQAAAVIRDCALAPEDALAVLDALKYAVQRLNAAEEFIDSLGVQYEYRRPQEDVSSWD